MMRSWLLHHSSVPGPTLSSRSPQKRTPLAAEPRNMTAASATSRILDAHVHLWAPADQQDRFPYAGQLIGSGNSSNEPPMPGHADVLLSAMQEAGVSGALIVQPGNHLYDHSYVTSALQQHPDTFVGCLLADPTPGGGGAAALEQLVTQQGYRAVRFNPYLWPAGEAMTNEVGRAMYAAAGRLGCPVGHMPFKGLLLHIGDIEALAATYPETTVIIDHFGFCKCDDLESAEWQALLGLARFPQVYVKASAWFRVSGQPYPYADVAAGLRRLVDVFGPERVMWGSDFPWITEQCGYSKAVAAAVGCGPARDPWAAQQQQTTQAPTQQQQPTATGQGGPAAAAVAAKVATAAGLSEEEMRWVMGETLASLFPGAFSSTAN